MLRDTYYAMKRRLGGCRLSVYDKNRIRNWYPVPGNIYHITARSEILFNHYVQRSRTASVTYWRTHLQAYSTMQLAKNRKL